MTLLRTSFVRGRVVEELLFAGKLICHVDSRLADVGYDKACTMLRSGMAVPLKEWTVLKQ